MNNKVHILILEDNQDGLDGLINFYKSIFLSFGFSSEFTIITNPKGSIIDTSKNSSAFDKNIVDLFICDLSLGDKSQNYFGLEVIKYVKSEYPELIVIANSYENITTAKISQYYPSFDLFVDKNKIFSRTYQQYVQEQIKSIFKRNIFLEIDWKNSTFPRTFQIEKNSNTSKITNILKNITFTTIDSDLKYIVKKVELRHIEDGLSSSSVFLMKSYLNNGLDCINSIIKISEKEKARVEKNNYLHHVKWNLPYTWRVELMNYCEWQEYGCICYSFANNDAKIKSITNYIRESKFDKIDSVIETIFDPENLTWYNKKNIGIKQSITQHYFSKWFSDFRGKERLVPRKVIEDLTRLYGHHCDQNFIYLNANQIARPESILFKDRGEYQYCVCHGDLSTNNVLLSEGNNLPVFIDFQDTGEGHIFEDFISFESCFRIYHKSSLNINELIDFELFMFSLANGSTEISKMPGSKHELFQQISMLREAALKSFEDSDFSSYVYGLAMSCYARLRNYLKNQDWQNKQLYCCLVASIIFLESLSKDNPKKFSKPRASKSNFDVFISFNSVVRPFVQDLIYQLRSNTDRNIWFDQEQLKGGDDILGIQEVIDSCEAFIVVFSDEGDGPWQGLEIKQIIANSIYDETKKIIPIIAMGSVNPKIPGFLKSRRRINFNNGFNEAFTELLSIIQ